jgi:hypothetical protein
MAPLLFYMKMREKGSFVIQSIIISCDGHRVNAVNENAPKDAPARVRVGIDSN